MRALRQEEQSHSEIMRTMHFLADVYGPRLTGSPHAKSAAEWVVKTMVGWGFENGHLEAWEFGHPGWENEHVTAHVVAPINDQLTVEVLAWTPGTKGTVTAPAFQLALPDRPDSGGVSTDISTACGPASRARSFWRAARVDGCRHDSSRGRRVSTKHVLRTIYDPNRDPSPGPRPDQ